MRDDYYEREIDMTTTAEELGFLSEEILANSDGENSVIDEAVEVKETTSSVD